MALKACCIPYLIPFLCIIMLLLFSSSSEIAVARVFKSSPSSKEKISQWHLQTKSREGSPGIPPQPPDVKAPRSPIPIGPRYPAPPPLTPKELNNIEA